MKKYQVKRNGIAGLLLVLALQVMAQNLFVSKADGSEAQLALSNLKKITFAGGSMVATLADNTTQSFAVTGINRLYFAAVPDGVSTIAADRRVLFSPVSGEIQVNCEPGTPISIYALNGRLVYASVQSISGAPIHVAHWPSGVYLVTVAGETFKISK